MKQASMTRRDGEIYIVSGHKWWTSGAPDPRCKIAIFMGKTDPSLTTYKQQSMILVPMDAPGVDTVRPLNVYGYDDAPHGHAEVIFKVGQGQFWIGLLENTCCSDLDWPCSPTILHVVTMSMAVVMILLKSSLSGFWK